MKSFDHVYQLHRLLRASRYPVSREKIEAELGLSRATVKRVIADLRDFFHAPIEYKREGNGYVYTQDVFELPGLWFRGEELAALRAMQELLASVQPGLLEKTLAPAQRALENLLEKQGIKTQFNQKIRLLSAASRASGACFETVSQAVLQQQQLKMRYYKRGDNSRSERTVSPQRLVRYRDAWYLDAWCHKADDLRMFALDAIESAELLEQAAQAVPEAALTEQLASAYGIFSGKATQTAVLRFNAFRARWISGETWHPDQRQHGQPDGSLDLHVPYHRSEELVMDILRYGGDVEVLSPPDLRAAVQEKLKAAVGLYG